MNGNALLRSWLLILAGSLTAASATGSALQRDYGREVLAPDDGFAALGDGTTGGASADDAHVFVVQNRAQLLAAINAGPTGAPRII